MDADNTVLLAMRADAARSALVDTLDQRLGYKVLVVRSAAEAQTLLEGAHVDLLISMFDLGERAKVIVLSVTEGEDKPLKYPHMFRAASVMILNKIDLLPHLDFDVAAAVRNAKMVNPDIEILQLSAKTGAGLDGWYAWIRTQARAAREAVLA